MSVAVPLSLAAVLALALAVCLVALRRAGVRAANAEARLGALAERVRAAQSHLRDLRAMPVLDAPPTEAQTLVAADSARRVRPDSSDARRGPRRAPRTVRSAPDPSSPARS